MNVKNTKILKNKSANIFFSGGREKSGVGLEAEERKCVGAIIGGAYGL